MLRTQGGVGCKEGRAGGDECHWVVGDVAGGWWG